MSNNLNFSISGEFLTEFLRRLWVELNCSRVDDIRKSISGMSKSQMIDLVTGSKKLVDSDNELLYKDDNATEILGIDLSIDNIRSRFIDSIHDKYYSIISYEKILSQMDSLDSDYDEAFKYYHELIESSYFELNNLRNNFKDFISLCKDKSIVPRIDFNKVRLLANEKVIDDSLKCKYVDIQLGYSKSLNFSPNDALIKLAVDVETYQLAELCKLTNTNGLNYLDLHKSAQKDCEKLRPYIFSENILETCWNSGWLSPKGKFYGCSDLSHNVFSSKLIKTLDLDEKSNDDVTLEDSGFIKFSCGRWLWSGFNDSIPTKEQYRVILNWAKERSDGKVYMSTDVLEEGWVNIDLLESKFNSK